MFPHCKDKDGKPLFIVKVKSSVKGAYKSEEVHKVLGKEETKLLCLNYLHFGNNFVFC